MPTDDRPADPAQPSGQAPGGGRPEFGPGGYLPERAARRARKIVLRGPMSLGWVVASVVAAGVLLAAGVWFLSTAQDRPDPPFVPVGALEELTAADARLVEADGQRVLVVAAGGLRAFLAPDPAGLVPGYCPESGRLEAPDGRVWTLSGRLVGGTGLSLRSVPAQVSGGTVYVDPTRPAPPPAPQPAGHTPACPS